MNHTKEHQHLVNEILLGLSKIPGVRAWPRRVGLAVPIHREEPVFFGVKGEADIQGIVLRKMSFYQKGWTGGQIGQFLGIEVKTGSGKRTKEQDAWRQMILDYGGAYFEARDVESCLTFVKSLTE